MQLSALHHGPRRRPDAGFSLIEAVLATVIVSVMLTAALRTVGSAVTARHNQLQLRLSESLGRDLLAEIMAMRFLEPCAVPLFGPEAGEARATFDDVDDYNGFSELGPRRKSGVAIPGTFGWRRAVAVARVTTADPRSTSVTDTGLKRITVTVTSPGGVQTVLVAVRCDTGFPDQPVPDAVTIYRSLGITLQASGTTTPVSTGVPLLNIPEN
ncbi:MAG TPA: prepilin-type N-terminal cleavage/methylation domain-containing protein [Phycisphaerales bacterium]|nr:prepilin-type N-terminal cleavage/methylation domain-containing protein [Phycisphaerales bacterium]